MVSRVSTSINKRECQAADLDPKEVERIARGISRYAREAEKLGLKIFGGSGSGSLRTDTGVGKGPLIVAQLDGFFDGGDGGGNLDEEGLLRGES